MFKVWDSIDHRATMDIDFLAQTSNQMESVRKIITEVSETEYLGDAITFEMSRIILRKAQTAGDYDGMSCSFSAKLFTAKIPILIDIGFNDRIIPCP